MIFALGEHIFFYIKRAVLARQKKKVSASQESCTILTTTFYQMFCLFFLYNSFHILNSSVTLFQEEWHEQQQHTIELWPPLLYQRASVLWCATRNKELFTNPSFKQKCCLYHTFTKWKQMGRPAYKNQQMFSKTKNKKRL